MGVLDKIRDSFKKTKESSTSKKLDDKFNKLQNEISNGKMILYADGVILKKGEYLIYSRPSNFLQERAVRKRISGWGGVRIMKGMWAGLSKGYSESHGVLRQIDSGKLILTNQQLIFNGSLRNYNFALKKIIHLEVYTDAIEIGIKDRQKVFVFSSSYPYLLSYKIKRLVNPDYSDLNHLKMTYTSVFEQLIKYIEYLSLDSTINTESFEKYVKIAGLVDYVVREEIKVLPQDKEYYPKVNEFSKTISNYYKTCSGFLNEMRIFDKSNKSEQEDFQEWLKKKNSPYSIESITRDFAKVQTLLNSIFKRV